MVSVGILPFARDRTGLCLWGVSGCQHCWAEEAGHNPEKVSVWETSRSSNRIPRGMHTCSNVLRLRRPCIFRVSWSAHASSRMSIMLCWALPMGRYCIAKVLKALLCVARVFDCLLCCCSDRAVKACHRYMYIATSLCFISLSYSCSVIHSPWAVPGQWLPERFPTTYAS